MLYDADGGEQAGYVTSFVYSPVLQRHIGIARVRPDLAPARTPAPPCAWSSRCNHRTTTVEATHDARLPLFNPPRKTADRTTS